MNFHPRIWAGYYYHVIYYIYLKNMTKQYLKLSLSWVVVKHVLHDVLGTLNKRLGLKKHH